MAMFDDETPPPGYRWEYSGSGNTAVRYPVPDASAAELSRDLIGTSVAPSLPTMAPELQPEPSTAIAPHRYAPGEVPGGPPQEPTLDQMKYELARSNLTPIDWLAGAGENALSLLTAPLGMLGGYAGLGYHMLRGAPFAEANARAADWARATSYQPTTLAGQEIAEDYVNPVLSRLPPVVSGINARALQVPRGTTGALSAGVKRDISQFDNDVFNAQRGITPGYPTLGSEFSDAFVTPRPTVYDMLAGLEPSRIPSTASPAVKTKGGNFPLSFDNDLEVSGQIGRHLSRKLSNIPLDENRIPNLAKRDPIVAEKWQDFIDSKDISYAQALYWRNNKEYHGRYKELVSEFIDRYKDELPQLTTLTDTEKLLQAQNSFIQNQYARYLTNEMGTGAKTDTLVRLAEQGIAVPEIAEVFDANYPGRAADLEGPWVLPAVKNLLEANKLKGIEAVQQTATTPYGKYIESLADEGVTPTSKKLYEDFLTLQKQLGLPTKYADKPTPFERIPEDMPIWDLPELWSNTELGLDRILEKLNTDLRSSAIKPENVKNVSIESLVRGLMDENLKKLEAERKLLLENLKATPRFNVPEPAQLSFVKSPGMTWIDIPETTDAKGLKLCTTLGKQAGWCTQDELTAQTYGSGDNRLTTLVDAEGRPHAQAKIVESQIDPISERFRNLSDITMQEIRAEAQANDPRGIDWGRRSDYMSEDEAKLRFKLIREATLRRFPKWNNLKEPPSITELKPPENSFTSERSKTYSKRDPEYKAKITDSVLKFLNAGDWGNVKDLDLYGILDTRNSSDLNAYAKRAKLSGDKAVLNKFEAAELLGRTRPGRFATDKEITEFINGPETLLYNHGSPTGGMTKLRTDINRTRAAGTGLWLAQPYETAGTYAGMKGSIYNVEVKNKDLDVLDAKNSEGGNIPLDAVIYHADGNKTTLKELADYLGVSTLSTDDVAKYSKSEGAKGLHILNVADISGRANPFVNTAPDYANNLVIFDPSIVKVIKEDKAPPFVPAGKAEGGAVRMADGGAVTDTLDKMVKSPQASNLLNLDLPNLIAAKQQVRPMKRGGKVDFSNNIDDMRYALIRFAQG